MVNLLLKKKKKNPKKNGHPDVQKHFSIFVDLDFARIRELRNIDGDINGKAIRNQLNYNLVKGSGCKDRKEKQTVMDAWVANCLRHAFPWESDHDNYGAYFPNVLEQEIAMYRLRNPMVGYVEQWCSLMEASIDMLPAPTNLRRVVNIAGT